MPANEPNEEQPKRKPPPRPKPGQKRFLSSVLNILSQSTTGTQYPDVEELPKSLSKSISKVKRITKEYEEIDEQFMMDIKENDAEQKKSKPKYKSRILNSVVSTHDNFIILQSRKDLTHTPSNYSEKGKDLSRPELVNPIRELLENNIYSGVAEGLAKEILEAHSSKKIIKIQDEPNTLVSEVPYEDDKFLYDIFKDLLETTYDVYNVETKLDTKVKKPETAMEIDEFVAKRLNFKDDIESKTPENEHLNFCVRDKILKHTNSEDQMKQVKNVRKPQIKKLKFGSFMQQKLNIIGNTTANTVNRKPLSKKARKRDLLNIFKEELKMDYNTYEEPKNLYQALREMALYKRKCRQKRQIHFDSDDKRFSNECLLTTRKIFQVTKSRKMNNKKKNDKIKTKDYPEIHNPQIRASIKKLDRFESNHSLEVYGLDYECTKGELCRKTFTPFSAASSELELDAFTTMGNSDSYFSIRGSF
ncbi:uncharacterized protein LOC126973863 [Leptidea sinapis]|uniref:uncharacterized protein LOC126973863 n=1 Tax=Leptidea sinapis TaxID=189913 RepID=UPI0021C3A37D|nr:uncharacterized protein LOC126973863 [Leptidea sinapis]